MAEKVVKLYDAQVTLGEGDGTRRFIISTDDEDREGDVLVPSGADLADYRRNPVVLWAHDYRQPPVGKAKSIEVSGRSLVATVEFAPTDFGKEVKLLVDQGFLKGASVGFDPIEWEQRQTSRGGYGRKYTKWALLEFSMVPVPANAFALVQRAKGMGLSIPAIEEAFSSSPEPVLHLAEDDEALWKQLDAEGEGVHPAQKAQTAGRWVEIDGLGLVNLDDLKGTIREQIQSAIRTQVFGKAK